MEFDFKSFAIGCIATFLAVIAYVDPPTVTDILETCMRYENMMYVDGDCIPTPEKVNKNES